MNKFDDVKFISEYKEVYQQFGDVREIAKTLYGKRYNKILFAGSGGAYTKFVGIRPLLTKYLSIPFSIVSPEELRIAILKDLPGDTLVVIGTKTGTTMELIKLVKEVKEKDIDVLGFIGDKNTEVAKYLNYHINSVNTDVHLVLLNLLFLQYFKCDGIDLNVEKYVEEMENFGQALSRAIEDNAEKAEKIVKKALDSDYQMWIGSGTLWGEVCCFCNYILEEIQWKKAQAVHGCEFFHGPFELVDNDIYLNIILNRSTYREIDERVLSFVKSHNNNHSIIDMNDFKLEGLSEEFYNILDSYVINMYLDLMLQIYTKYTGKSSKTRRYYRKFEY